MRRYEYLQMKLRAATHNVGEELFLNEKTSSNSSSNHISQHQQALGDPVTIVADVQTNESVLDRGYKAIFLVMTVLLIAAGAIIIFAIFGSNSSVID